MAATRPESSADDPSTPPVDPGRPDGPTGRPRPADPVAAALPLVPKAAPVEAATPGSSTGRVARAGRRVAQATVVARDASVSGLVTAVTPVVRAVGVLLLAVLAALVAPAVLLLVVAWWRPGPADWFWTVVALAAFGVAGWLWRRRRQLLDTVADRERLVTALTRVLRGRDIADRLTSNLAGTGVRVAGRTAGRALRGSRGLRLLRGMWRGVQLTGIVDELVGAPEIAALLPGRVRGIAVLTVVALIAAGVVWVCLAVATLAFLAGA